MAHILLNNLVIVKENNLKNNKLLNVKDKLNNKRLKSFQQLLTDKTLENKIKNLLKEKRNINKIF